MSEARAATPLDFRALVACLPCRDLAATRAFYGRDLGLALTLEADNHIIFHVAVGAYLSFRQDERALSTHDPLAESDPILCLLSDDVAALYRRFKRLAIETEGPPKRDVRLSVDHFFARDPDGYRLEVRRSLTPVG